MDIKLLREIAIGLKLIGNVMPNYSLSRGREMKCDRNISKMCLNAIQYKKYAEVRQCEKCCLYCKNRCHEVCEKAKGEEK